MNKERLLLLADFLEKLPEERFDYVSWVGHNWRGKQDLSCQTTACALGWAATIPEFRAAGLGLSYLSGYPFSKQGYVCLVGDPPAWDVVQANFFATRAACRIFDISSRQASCLFVPGETMKDEASAKDIAELIRYFVTFETVSGFQSSMRVHEEE